MPEKLSSELVNTSEGKKIVFTKENPDAEKKITIESLKQAQESKNKTRTNENENSPYNMGQKRMEKISSFFSKVSEKISSGWDNVKSIAKDIGINLLSFPELMQAGAKEIGRSAKEDIYQPGKEAVETGVKYFKKDRDETIKHIKDTKESVKKGWEATKEHGKLAAKVVKGIGLKVSETFNNTKEFTKSAIEKKLGQLKEYSESIRITAEGIKDSAHESIKKVIKETEIKITNRINKLKTDIDSRLTKFHDKVTELKLRRQEQERIKAEKAEEKRNLEAAARLKAYYEDALRLVQSKEDDLRKLKEFITKYEQLKNTK
jgi:hypothetical protein